MTNRNRAGKRRYRTRRRAVGIFKRPGVLPALALILAGCSVVGFIFGTSRESGGAEKSGAQAEASYVETGNREQETLPSVTVGRVMLAGLTPEQVRARLKEAYPWEMKVKAGEESALLENLLEPQIDEILKKLENRETGETRNYGFDYDRLRHGFKQQAAELAGKWDKKPVDSQMESFDKETGAYQYSKDSPGRALDQERLVEELMKAAEQGDFSREIEAVFKEIPPKRTQAQAKEQYRVIGTFTTETTNNKNRNQNIHLASQALDGIVLKPGEEFSFNMATGNRTSEKGYQPAGAYRNGVLIEEPGGGVCQVSTTLYHAIIKSGFKTTERNFHSFAPGYIEKGQDAMVSFDGYAGPDLKFINTQDTAVGLRASFQGNRLKLSIVGLPSLEEGTTVSIRSEKVKDIEPPEPIYEENPELAYGEERIVEKAQPGSVWKSYRVVKKAGQTIEETPLYTSTYKAKPARIQKNSNAAPYIEETGREDEAPQEPVLEENPSGLSPEMENVLPGEAGSENPGQEEAALNQGILDGEVSLEGPPSTPPQ